MTPPYEVWGVVVQTNGLSERFRLLATTPASEGRIRMEGVIPVTGHIAPVELCRAGKDDVVREIPTYSDGQACVAGQEFAMYLTLADMP